MKTEQTELVPSSPQLPRTVDDGDEQEMQLPVVTNPLQLYAMAIQKKTDVATLERLQVLVERHEARESKKKFDAAISAFQIECPILKRTVLGPSGKYKYAPLDHVVVQIKPLLQKHEISFTFTSEPAEGGTTVTCHISAHGHTQPTSVFMPKDSGKTRDGGASLMSDPQQMAVAISFAQRYALQLALGIVTAGDDKDGMGPGIKQQGPSRLQPTDATLKQFALDLWTALKPVRGPEKNWKRANEWLHENKMLPEDKFAPNLTQEEFQAAIGKVQEHPDIKGPPEPKK